MTDWFSGDVTTNGIRVHYTRTGGDKPPLVLAHGYSDSGLCWTAVACELEGTYDVIMPDSRGHGCSDAPESGYGKLALAADLAGFIDALGLDRPAVLGHSMGGSTAMALASVYPELPGAILIEDSGMFSGRVLSDAERQARRESILAGIARYAATSREALMAECRVNSPTWAEAEIGPWADAKKRLSPNVVVRTETDPIGWPDLLPRIVCPALLITADNALGAMVTPETAAEMQGLISGLQVTHIAGAGHSIHREQFSCYMDVVGAFLERWAADRSRIGA